MSLSRSQLKSLPSSGRKQSSRDISIGQYTQWSHAGDRNARCGKFTITGSHQFERIQKIAADLFATRGYRAVGVAEIGDAVGLGRGALYYHIGSKEDLLFSIVVRYIEDLVISGGDTLETVPDPESKSMF